MGNGLRKLSLCLTGHGGGISRRKNGGTISAPPDEGFGHSFCYIPTEPARKATQLEDPAPAHQTPLFHTISGAAISANTFTHLSTDAAAAFPSLDKASAFESSSLFSSIPLQPIPRNTVQTVKSGPILRNSGPGSDPIEGGFLSGPIERSFISGPLDTQLDQLQRYMPKSKKRAFLKNFRSIARKSPWSSRRDDKDQNFYVFSGSYSGNSSTITSHNLSTEMSLVDENDDVGNESFGSQNFQWAQGKAGEDRVHIVISEEHGWVFVGIYDGFNGPDATDFLLNNLYSSVYKELKGLLWSVSCENDGKPDLHSNILKAMSEALSKTEASFLEMADLMLIENPELALMGSCVLVMVMKGLDVYLMNVGDSRAVLAQKFDNHPENETTRKHQEESLYGYEYENVHSFTSRQLTMDHTTCVHEEVRRIKCAHPEDPLAVANDRVKGSLKVTRAFGAGFLKKPKWNKALLEMFRIGYIGNSPYITCTPSLFHHTIKPEDKFLILSSDGLYQYFTNQEVVSEVEVFMSTFPEGDPAQHLVEEVLFRAAKKAGMDFHELLDIPQGDRRKYHDDVSIIIISIEGRIWRSSV